MLLELRAGQLEHEEENDADTLQELEKLLTSKDFEVWLMVIFLFRSVVDYVWKSALKGHLTACMLSPNLTVYVTDTQQHIMVC